MATTIYGTNVQDTYYFGSSYEDYIIYAYGGPDNIYTGFGNDIIYLGTGLPAQGGLKHNSVLSGAGNDTIYGDVDVDNAYGNDGNDTLYGYGGNDSLNGGNGDDYLDGGDGVDILRGNAGNDILLGGAGNDSLFGGAGSDHLMGGDGDDRLSASDNNSTISGDVTRWASGPVETASNILDGGAGNDLLLGSQGADTLIGGTGDDLMLGNLGNDIFLTTGGGFDRLYGGTGADTFDLSTLRVNYRVDRVIINDFSLGEGDTLVFAANETFSWVEAKAGTVSVTTSTGDRYDFYNTTIADLAQVSSLFSPWNHGGGTPVTPMPEADQPIIAPVPTANAVYVYGTDAQDWMRFSTSTSDHVIYSYDGPDQIWTGSGNDIIYTGEGTPRPTTANVSIFAGGGDDFVKIGTVGGFAYGEDGNDTLYGGNRRDNLYGGNGNDYLSGGAGNDSVNGEAGNDILFGDSGNDNLYGGIGADQLHGGDGDDHIAAYDNSMQMISSDVHVDVLDGGTGNDDLYGDYGGDILIGGKGSDRLFAEAGDDTLRTDGGGFDYLVGGAGADTFDFSTLRGNGTVDRVVVEDFDFAQGDSLVFGPNDSISFVQSIAGTVSINMSTGDTFDFYNVTTAELAQASTLISDWLLAA